MPRRHGGFRIRFRSRTVGGFAIGLVLALAGTEAASAAPFDSGSLPGSASIGSLSSSAGPESPADGTWGQNPLALSAAEGSVRSHALTWQPKGSPRGDLKALVSSPLTGIARVDPDLATATESGAVEIPLFLSMPALADDSYVGTVQLADDNGPIGAPLQITVTTEFADATRIPADLTPPSEERLGVLDDFERVSDELLVTVDANGQQDDIIRAAAIATGAAIYGADSNTGFYQLRYRGNTVEEVEKIKSQVRSQPGVTNVLSNYVASPAASYTDPGDEKMGSWSQENDANWGLRAINAQGAWQKLGSGGNPNVKVGIIDAGPVDDYHEDLVRPLARSPHVGAAADYISTPSGQHSSHVAGIACAAGNNGIGITGVAQHCDLRDYFSRSANSNLSNGKVLSALVHEMRTAGKERARVVNISLGFYPKTFVRPYECDGKSPTIRDHTKEEFRNGLANVVKDYPSTLWVVSAGNACVNAGNSFPAALAGDSDPFVADRVVAVAASGRYGNWASYSNYGNAVTVVAPGGDKSGAVLSTVPVCKRILWTISCNSGYLGDYGTSMAAPYVTGTAALMLSKTPDATPVKLKNCFRTGMSASIARPGDSTRSYPLLDAAQSVECIKQAVPTEPGAGEGQALPVEPAAAVATGPEHSCAVLQNGGVRCWGLNNVGQLGDGTTALNASPVDVVGISSAVDVGVAMEQSCAVLVEGRVRCWGVDYTRTKNTTPTDVVGIDNALRISMGSYHSCVLLRTGGVRCWGHNENSQLGQEGTGETPLDVIGITDATEVSAGDVASCAVLSGGGVNCWGTMYAKNMYEGASEFTASLTPVRIAGVDNAVSVSVGYAHACATLKNGGAKCWGLNGSGVIGDGTREDRLTPVNVLGMSNIIASIGTGYEHSCAAISNENVKCWGSNGSGAIGDGTRDDRLTPANVDGTKNALMVATGPGSGHSCAILAGGSVRCWGVNFFGQLGDGTRDERLRPVNVISFGAKNEGR